jgi:hypothetical protein
MTITCFASSRSDVVGILEAQGVSAFRTSGTHVLDTLRMKVKTFSDG